MLKRFLTLSALALSLITSGVAQDKEKIKQLTPSAQGSTGLFNLYLADTLRRGEVSLGLNITHFNREPGDLDFTLFPVSITVGLHDRVEFFVAWETHRRVNGNAILVNKVGPGDPIVPARLNNSMGSVGFFNDSPFLDVGSGQGSGELRSGLKFNLLSEVRDNRLSLAIQPIIKWLSLTSERRLNITHFNREPGDLDFTLFPVSITVGLHDRVEFFVAWETHRRVNGNAILVNKVGPGDPIVPARLNNSMGSVGFFNDSPFLDVGSGQGSGELRSGLKFNLLSEVRGNRLSLAIQPIIKFPLSQSRTRLLQGLTNGTLEAGYDLILSKNVAHGGTLTGNYGHLFAGDSQGIRLQHRMNYGLGFEMPIGAGSVRAIGELVGPIMLESA